VFLIFDAYGTLAELDDFYGRLQRSFAARSIDLSLDAITHAAHREMRYYMKNSLRAHQVDAYEVLRRECAEVLVNDLREQGHTVPLSSDEAIAVLSESIVFQLFPETAATLEALQQRGVRMGVASNWDAQLAGILEELGIARYFSFILSSAQIGHEKPAPEFFDWIKAEALKAQTDNAQLFYIGDHWDKDVVPSQSAGFTPLWLERSRRDIASGELPSSVEGVQKLRTLQDILSVI
jgi:FMN phosphatase YigB (HAD superfamily)